MISYLTLLSACKESDSDRCFGHGGAHIDGVCYCDVNADDTSCKTRLSELFKNTAIADDFIFIDYIGTDKGIRRDTEATEERIGLFASRFTLASEEKLPNVDIHDGDYAFHIKAPDLGIVISIPDYPKHIEDEWQFFGCKFVRLEGLEPLIEVTVSQYAFRGFCKEENIETIYWTTRNLDLVAFKVIASSKTNEKGTNTYLNLAATTNRGVLKRQKELPDYVPRNK